MWNVSFNSHGREHIEYKNFLSDLFIDDFVKELKQKGYTDIKIINSNFPHKKWVLHLDK